MRLGAALTALLSTFVFAKLPPPTEVAEAEAIEAAV